MYLHLGAVTPTYLGVATEERSNDFRWIAPAGRGNPGPDERGCVDSRKKPVSDHFSLTHIVES